MKSVTVTTRTVAFAAEYLDPCYGGTTQAQAQAQYDVIES